MKLNAKEIAITELLGRCYDMFRELHDHHPCDHAEFAQHIHILQRQVMARLARREHPTVYGAKK